MSTDMRVWRQRAVNQLKIMADEEFQRKVWFGHGEGRWVDSPTEQICKYDDLFVPIILQNPESGLTANEKESLASIDRMMDDLVESTPDSISPEYLIDDPRWVAIRKQAAMTLDVLSRVG